MSRRKEVVLIVDDEKEFRDTLVEALEDDFSILSVGTVEEAQARIDQGVSLVMLDVRLGGIDDSHREGLDLLGEVAESHPSLPVVIMTGYANIDTAVEAMRLGAADFIQKGQLSDVRELVKVVNHNLDRFALRRKVEQLEGDLKRLEPWELVGDDPKIHEVRGLIDLVKEPPPPSPGEPERKSATGVLIIGATGTGKELVARAIHSRGARGKGPFSAVNISALAKDVVESELFGHVKGAFTGAHATRIGYIEKADNGVLFLDEIGDLSPALQLKLLRVLDNNSFARVGSTQEIDVDIQVVAATNRDLEKAIEDGHVREDFYYRLKSFVIELPLLRDRSGDIPLLVDHFLFLLRQQGRTKLAGISTSALKLLSQYPFPGNVRELRSVVERAMILADSRKHKVVQPDDLPPDIHRQPTAVSAVSARAFPEDGVNLEQEVARTELRFIQEALDQAQGKKTEAWRLLGLNDRFALRRRVLRAKEGFPELLKEFPRVEELYS